MSEIALTIEEEKIGGHILSGEIYFTLGSDGSYIDFPSDDELIDYELYDENNDLFEVDTDKMERLILKAAVKIYKRTDFEEDDSTDTFDEF
tara:strand:- start:129 stop:401 length:273 start_codon:yes stop_codon:yes gene_type:complete